MRTFSIVFFWSMQNKSQAENESESEFSARWIQHQDADGMFYYEDTANNTVTWMAPVGEEYIRWVDPEA
ncbi:hypothetical protein FisN_26Lu088 [Fistulifera solaris]|uniref:WW domain-containing protein n=1 Tax=Fistulifera solaris TaxID=1519565 RepID=A0A1Z5KDI5_FISSO|nr:hypothetical protein FisN_26Lu088 [Fistulifera solaris]|eukprot:GAX24018.1 hypothetical protein FisN_26Lu088 [Fistulifera solaris]